MLPVIAILVAIALTLVCALLSAEEAASALVAPGRALRLVESERPGARALERLLDKAYRLRAAAAIASALAYTGVAVAASWILFNYAGTNALTSGLVGAAVSIAIVVSLGHALPRTVAVQNPEDVALTFARAALEVATVLYVPAKALSLPWLWGMRLAVGQDAAASPWITEDEFRAAHPADEEIAREETEEALLEAVSDFADKVVREVMVPRTDMVCLPDTATAADAIAMIEAHGYSRLPIYHDTADDVRGVLYAKDLLSALSRDVSVAPSAIAREAYFVPETKPVQELLIEMRARTHIAIVADEYGGTAGLVTIEDLLEEIVGEIFDEYDRQVPLVTELADGRVRIDARLPVDDLNERFDTAIESESDTVGGVVAEVAGRIPEVGDAIQIEGLRLVVEEVLGTRITQLVVESAGANGDGREHDA